MRRPPPTAGEGTTCNSLPPNATKPALAAKSEISKHLDSGRSTVASRAETALIIQRQRADRRCARRTLRISHRPRRPQAHRELKAIVRADSSQPRRCCVAEDAARSRGPQSSMRSFADARQRAFLRGRSEQDRRRWSRRQIKRNAMNPIRRTPVPARQSGSGKQVARSPAAQSARRSPAGST